MPDYFLGPDPSEPSNPLLETVRQLQGLLISHATDGREDEDRYRAFRQELVKRRDLEHLVPEFLRDYRTLSGFRTWIKDQSGQWEPRRAIIREAFADLIDHLEFGQEAPADAAITHALTAFDVDGVRAAWSKALERRQSDPEGAITSARTLLETVCKIILDRCQGEGGYSDRDDLPKLYGATAKALSLAPDDHTEQVFKSILGGCQNIVNNLGTLRNRLGDAHGSGRRQVRPSPRHAALAVNLAGSMAMFLIETASANFAKSKAPAATAKDDA